MEVRELVNVVFAASADAVQAYIGNLSTNVDDACQQFEKGLVDKSINFQWGTIGVEMKLVQSDECRMDLIVYEYCFQMDEYQFSAVRIEVNNYVWDDAYNDLTDEQKVKFALLATQ